MRGALSTWLGFVSGLGLGLGKGLGLGLGLGLEASSEPIERGAALHPRRQCRGLHVRSHSKYNDVEP